MSTYKNNVRKKIILVGDPGSGKSSYLNRYINNKYSPHVKATIGADFLTKQIVIDDITVTLQIWDTAGRERWAKPGVMFFRGSDGVIIFFELTNKLSFEHAVGWKKELETHCPQNVPIVLVGTKLDLEQQRVVRMEVAEELAEQWNVPYIEISSKDNVGVQEAMRMLTDQIQIREEFDEEPPLQLEPQNDSPSYLWNSVSTIGSWFYSWMQPAPSQPDEKKTDATSNLKSLPGN